MYGKGKGAINLLGLAVPLVAALGGEAQAAPTAAPIFGEIQRITIRDASDIWSNGTIVIGGQLIAPALTAGAHEGAVVIEHEKTF